MRLNHLLTWGVPATLSHCMEGEDGADHKLNFSRMKPAKLTTGLAKLDRYDRGLEQFFWERPRPQTHQFYEGL